MNEYSFITAIIVSSVCFSLVFRPFSKTEPGLIGKMAYKEKDQSKHDKIIEAAIKVFAKKGFYNAKVSEIAREANVADGTIYLYFKNKDDILITLFEEKVDLILGRMEEALANVDDPLEKIRTFVEHHLRLTHDNKYLAEVIQIELRSSSKFMRRYVPVKFLED